MDYFPVIFLTILFASHQSVLGKKPFRCHCDGEPSNPDCESPTCETDGVCFHLLQRLNGRMYRTRGCFSRAELKRSPFHCRESASPDLVFECCKEEFCNNQSVKLPTQTPTEDDEDDTVDSATLAIIIASVIGSLLISAVVIVILIKRCRTKLRLPVSDAGSENSTMLLNKAEKDFELTENKEPLDDWSTGSGAGLPLLVLRSIARQIQIQEVIGKGRYGEVYRGEWKGGENVAVKKFSSRDERSWFREAEIYQTVMLRHDSILGFIGADNKDNGTWTELWLVTEYHENGSLFDYLTRTQVDQAGLFKFTISITSGLEHLHTEIVGTQGKPPIAHRDLKSKNILVKKNGECAIADLGLAVRHDSASDTIDIPLNNRVGTIRYMAPEVLAETLNLRHFDSFKRADIYSLGLMFWEIARRSDIGGQCMSYELPFFDDVPNDPSIEEMREAVCLKKMRPPGYPLWEQNDCLRGFYKLMRECWYENGCARLTALRVKKDLKQLQDDEGIKIV